MKFYCNHSDKRSEFTPICDDDGAVIAALCLECGNDQTIHNEARTRAILDTAKEARFKRGADWLRDVAQTIEQIAKDLERGYFPSIEVAVQDARKEIDHDATEDFIHHMG